jgi:hypothetical protein
MPHNLLISHNRSVYEIMWKNADTVRHATVGNIIRRIRFVSFTTQATDTHSEYAVLICCFSTATMVMRTRLNVTSYVQFLSCKLNTICN